MVWPSYSCYGNHKIQFPPVHIKTELSTLNFSLLHLSCFPYSFQAEYCCLDSASGTAIASKCLCPNSQTGLRFHEANSMHAVQCPVDVQKLLGVILSLSHLRIFSLLLTENP